MYYENILYRLQNIHKTIKLVVIMKQCWQFWIFLQMICQVWLDDCFMSSWSWFKKKRFNLGVLLFTLRNANISVNFHCFFKPETLHVLHDHCIYKLIRGLISFLFINIKHMLIGNILFYSSPFLHPGIHMPLHTHPVEWAMTAARRRDTKHELLICW